MTPAQRQAEAARLNNLGDAEGKQGNHQAALQYFEEAIKLRPQVSW
ncbi:tetratricopeptide repeat protein [Limnofasciculus baicalensis]|uniref:Tetratricopeptide repeat protein n=1 Tax=Limnofasciculus baicalensis BBK-W-15 TaxID=2699891 RepID=A0AAE3KLR3_9CYAN|nr:tetratricopeptide repeat protein [Limnofasciculus baicalensis]MCP2727951.1 tetratricopeptide repeat protein [Limnofasciculus baicalensis BBK-W-15]